MAQDSEHNISLSHSNTSLNINNTNDVKNIDNVLSKAIEVKGNEPELIKIFSNTSFKYLKRLQEDGLIKDSNGPNVVPIYNPKVTSKAIKFYQNGGYTSLYENENSESKTSITLDM